MAGTIVGMFKLFTRLEIALLVIDVVCIVWAGVEAIRVFGAAQ